MLQDKRKAQRRPIHHSAWLALSAGEFRGCMLSDVSDTGARINVEDAETLPDRFFLLLSKTGAARRVCRVVWRKSSQLGVRFERSYTGAGHDGQAALDEAALEPDPAEPR
jgi:hypothetical protein